MTFLTLRSWDPGANEWTNSTILPRELHKTLAWKLYLGHNYFRIGHVEVM